MSYNRKVFQEATLSSNCPECYANNSLLLTVYQNEVDTPWFYKLTSKLSEEIECQKCGTAIYPVRYTEDLERVKAFYLKSMGTPETAFKLKALSFVVLALVILAAAASVLVLNQPDLFTAVP